MRRPQRALELADPSDGCLKLRLVERTGREGAVERPLALDDLLTERDRADVHAIVDRANFGGLLFRQLELSCQIEDVPGAGVMIELGRLRHAVPRPLLIGLDLLGRERLDLVALASGIRALPGR